MRLFHRTFPVEWDAVVADVHRLGEVGDPPTRVVASNLIADHRVSPHCATIFMEIYRRELGSDDALANALTRYRVQIARDPQGTFLHPGNRSNFVPPSTHDRLHHVWNLTSFFLHSVKISDLETNPISGLPVNLPKGNIPALNALLERCLSSPSFLPEVVALRNVIISTPGRSWHPMWAAPAEDLARVISPRDPSTWFFPLGLNLNSGDEAVLVRIEYQRPPDLQLVRPTQLEARNNPHHLPSPNTLAMPDGGLALRLDYPDWNVTNAVREYLHLDVPFDPGSIVEHCPPVELNVGWDGFVKCRKHQIRHYRAKFPSETPGWFRSLRVRALTDITVM